MLAALAGVVEFEEPVNHVDPVNHQVGEDTTAEVPEPAPLAEFVGVELLLLRRAEEALPIDGFRVEGILEALSAAGVAVPGEMDLADLPGRSVLQHLVCLLNVGHAALLHADLHDALVRVLGPSMTALPSDRSWVSGFST